jgi:hypothetical protein
MAATASASFSAPAWQRTFSRAGSALPLSILVHAAVLYSVSRFGWIAPQQLAPERPAVVWLTDYRPAEVEPAPVVETIVPVDRTPAERAAPSDEPPTVAPRPAAPLVDPRPPQARAGAETEAVAPVTTEPRPTILAPTIDWEKERKTAASRVIEARALEESHRTFSLDDIPEDDHGVAPRTPPTAIAETVKDPCAIVRGRLQRFAMQLIGRCVRDARGDLFAHLKPGYLAMLPICEESVPEQPALAAARSQEFPTIKCRLAAPAD